MAKCPNPNCNHSYMENFDYEKTHDYLDKEDPFYKASNNITMEQETRFFPYKTQTTLLGYPKCGTVFIDV